MASFYTTMWSAVLATAAEFLARDVARCAFQAPNSFSKPIPQLRPYRDDPSQRCRPYLVQVNVAVP